MLSFTLTHDIANPNPDRRSSDWRKQPIIPKGTRVRVESTEDRSETVLRFTVPPCHSYQYEEATTYGTGQPVFSSDLAALLYHAHSQADLEETPEDIVTEAFQGCDIATETLCELLRSGRITHDDLTASAHAVLTAND